MTAMILPRDRLDLRGASGSIVRVATALSRRIDLVKALGVRLQLVQGQDWPSQRNRQGREHASLQSKKQRVFSWPPFNTLAPKLLNQSGGQHNMFRRCRKFMFCRVNPHTPFLHGWPLFYFTFRYANLGRGTRKVGDQESVWCVN